MTSFFTAEEAQKGQAMCSMIRQHQPLCGRGLLRPAFWPNLGCLPSHFNAAGRDLRGALTRFVPAQGAQDSAEKGWGAWEAVSLESTQG